MDSKVEISGKVLARNTLLNFIGLGAPLLVGIVAIPYIMDGLGPERFGLLSLAWVVLGYFSIFDLGLGRATTKFVAEALGKNNEEEVPRLIWTSVTVQAIVGIFGALILIVITPFLAERALNIPIELIAEAKVTFYLLSFSIPVVLVSSTFSGVLVARQRFDLVNIVGIPSSTLTFILPLIGLLLNFNLPGIVALVLVGRLASLSAYLLLNIYLTPYLRKYANSFDLFPKLFSFGGWVTVTSIVGPFLLYLDRFIIASLLSIAAVAFYSAPYEAITRITIISVSLVMTLFPAFSAIGGVDDRHRLETLFARSVKYVLLTIGPVVLIIELFANEILLTWLGPEFAIESTLALQILALGVFINSLAHTPFTLLQAIGRPDIPAKFHLLEIILYVGIAWFFVSNWGITGAAAAWTLRVALDAIFLFIAAFRICRFSTHIITTNGLTIAGFFLLLLIVIAYLIKMLSFDISLFIQFSLFLILFCLFAWVVWKKVLDDLDKNTMLKALKRQKNNSIDTRN